MKKGLITTILCFIIAAVVVVIGYFFIKSLGNDNTEVKDEGQQEIATAPDGTQGSNTGDTTVSGDADSSNPDAPVSNNADDSVSSSDTPVTDSENTDSSNDEQSTPSYDGSGQTEEGSQGQSTPPSPPADTTPEVEAVPVGTPTSYKDFSITKGMSAKDASAKLDEFLSSKYSILLNKQNKVADNYAPTDLITPSGCAYPMERVAGNALVQLMSAARQSGISDLVMYSGYRTVASQRNKFETRTNKYLQQGYSRAEAEAKAGEYIAPPGASEHHTGLAADVCSSAIVNKYGQLVDSFDQTASYRWMRDNCTRFGFIIRYTKGDEGITGYSYEPWHMRYLGVEHATACTQLGLTYEEYYSLITKLRDEAKAQAGA